MSAISLASAQQSFVATQSAIEDAVHFAFRRCLRPQDYEEALAEARAAWGAWHGLVGRGKDPVAVGVHGIARNAVRHVRNGRRVGGGTGRRDVYHHTARECGLRLVGLDAGDAAESGASTWGSWREWLAEDRRVTPADEAAFRVDFEGWLATLPDKRRRVAELLAGGHEGVVVAREVDLSPGRVCQLRAALEASSRAFQGLGEGDTSRAAAATG